jgi:hypothetical protein
MYVDRQLASYETTFRHNSIKDWHFHRELFGVQTKHDRVSQHSHLSVRAAENMWRVVHDAEKLYRPCSVR